MVDGHEAIKNATSILDYVFRSLGYDYLKRQDFVHVKAVDEIAENGKHSAVEHDHGHEDMNFEDEAPEAADEAEFVGSVPEPASPVSATPVPPARTSLTNVNGTKNGVKNGAKMKSNEAKRFGYTGEQCAHCGSIRVRQNGSCTVCDDCGGTSGCS
jgi:ribonucleoside-diphosphate reductase alpha chain